VWSGDPFTGITGGLTNNGTIETVTTVQAVQKALLELDGEGTVVLKAAGGGAISGSVALSQNVEIAANGKLVAPVETTPFTGGHGKTITSGNNVASALDFGSAEITAIGATVTNYGTNAAAIATAAETVAGNGGNASATVAA
jgi:hypothetical protein